MEWWIPVVSFGPAGAIVVGGAIVVYREGIGAGIRRHAKKRADHRLAKKMAKQKLKHPDPVNAIEDLYRWKQVRRRNDRAEWNAAYEALLNEIYPPKTYHRHRAIDPIEQMRRHDWDEYNDRAGLPRATYRDEDLMVVAPPVKIDTWAFTNVWFV